MKLYEVTYRHAALIKDLVTIWESSVRATHFFLANSDIEQIKQYVPQALKEVPILVVVENNAGHLVGFMGISDEKLEMLFILNENRGQGIGKILLQYGVEKYSIKELTVNEQNPKAKGFYEHMGFEVYKRTAQDEQGNPYPLLYMKR